MYYVYALVSERDGSMYIGQTDDVHRRLREHNSGRTRSTKSRGTYKLAYVERCSSREEAVARERKLKQGSGREFLKSKIKSFMRL